jgi:xanthine dehydrogenase accessory factor
LLTVIKTWGSSPRPEGAMLAICEDGVVVGSVSGGCSEDDLIAKVRAEGITRTRPEIVTYGITVDEAHRFGLRYGGTIQLAIEPISAASRIGELLQRLARHELVARRLEVGALVIKTFHVKSVLRPGMS